MDTFTARELTLLRARIDMLEKRLKEMAQKLETALNLRADTVSEKLRGKKTK